MDTAQRPKRILIFSVVYYPRFIGGAEIAVKEITDRLPPDEYKLEMVALRLDASLPRTERIGNVTVHRIGPAGAQREPSDSLTGILHYAKYLYPFQALLAAHRFHRERPFDAVWSIMANYAGFAALFFKFFHPRVPFLLTLQEGDPIPYIKRRVRFVYPLFRRIFTRADGIQAISRYLAAWARSMGARAPVTVIPNGVDRSHFSRAYPPAELSALREKLGWGRGDILLITTSRLVVKNAVGDVIAALRFLPQNVKLLILGTGYEEERLKVQVSSSQFQDRVRFLGYVPHSELPKYLKAADIFVRPSLSEGMGNSFIEAMAAGLPVIATPVGGIVDFLRDGETGLFCEPGKPATLARAVERLRDDGELRRRLAENGRRLAMGRYDWGRIAGEMRGVFAAFTR